jgi:hypothetical protein
MIKINQLAGMNIHYLFYSLKEFFFAYQQKIGISSVELWGGAPHFFFIDAFTGSVAKF